MATHCRAPECQPALNNSLALMCTGLGSSVMALRALQRGSSSAPAIAAALYAAAQGQAESAAKGLKEAAGERQRRREPNQAHGGLLHIRPGASNVSPRAARKPTPTNYLNTSLESPGRKL